ncbi:MAG: RNA polymerase sigma factor [Flavobacteriales bacterium]|nr:RNA polymerase sigma factor [Flavobacteriales bacterium]
MKPFVNPSSTPVDPVVLRRWIERSQAKESEGYRLIYERFAPVMILAIRRYIKSEADALDVLQDGFLKVFANIEGYTFRGSFEGWMRRIMVNTAIDALRSRKSVWLVGDNEEMLDNIVDDALSEEEEPVWATLGQDDIIEAMDQLTPMYRAVFNLFAIEQFGHKDIALKLGISVGTSKSNYAKARRNLKVILMERIAKGSGRQSDKKRND